MRFTSPFITSCLWLLLEPSNGFILANQRLNWPRPSVTNDAITVLWERVPTGRRDFMSHLAIGAVSACLVIPNIARAEEPLVDPSMSIFNADGSLKQDVETEAKFRTLSFNWDPSDVTYLVNQDGDNVKGTPNGSKVRVSYQVPEKWISNEGSKYFDPSVKASACDRIIVYQAPGTTTIDRLEKASTLGIAKALAVTDDLKALYSSDLISGRTTKRDDQKFFEFDCAVAPSLCSNSKDNLGLGFCPYETIYLLSATQVDDKLYVMVIESGRTEWKQANSDLKRVRSTLRVEPVN